MIELSPLTVSATQRRGLLACVFISPPTLPRASPRTTLTKKHDLRVVWLSTFGGALTLLAAVLIVAPRIARAESAPLDMYDTRSTALLEHDRVEPTDVTLFVDGVFGPDTRERILSTTTSGARMTVWLRGEFPSGDKFTCSGFMLGPRTVGTAGHCVHSAEKGGWVKSMLVMPAANGSTRPFGESWAIEVFSAAGWTRDADGRFDFGALTLESDIGTSTGTFGMRDENDAVLTRYPFSITGYPGDKPAGTMWLSTGTITAVDARRVYFSIDVTHGNSGGPVWGRTTSNEYIVLGIVSGGNDRINTGVRVNQPVIDQFVLWRSRAGTTTSPPPAPAPAVIPASRSITASPTSISVAAGAIGQAVIAIRAVEGGGNLLVTTTGGILIANGERSPSSCASGTTICVNTGGNSTTQLVIPDAGNDLSGVLLTLSGTVTSTKTVTILAAQGGVTLAYTMQVFAQAPTVQPAATTAPSPSAAVPPTGAGSFAAPPVFSTARLAQVVFLGGSIEQMDSALRSTGASGVWAQAPDGGFILYIVGGGFVNSRFNLSFPNGFRSLAALTLVGK